mgnify:CR=1 FL=1
MVNGGYIAAKFVVKKDQYFLRRVLRIELLGDLSFERQAREPRDHDHGVGVNGAAAAVCPIP